MWQKLKKKKNPGSHFWLPFLASPTRAFKWSEKGGGEAAGKKHALEKEDGEGHTTEWQLRTEPKCWHQRNPKKVGYVGGWLAGREICTRLHLQRNLQFQWDSEDAEQPSRPCHESQYSLKLCYGGGWVLYVYIQTQVYNLYIKKHTHSTRWTADSINRLGKQASHFQNKTLTKLLLPPFPPVTGTTLDHQRTTDCCHRHWR